MNDKEVGKLWSDHLSYHQHHEGCFTCWLVRRLVEERSYTHYNVGRWVPNTRTHAETVLRALKDFNIDPATWESHKLRPGQREVPIRIECFTKKRKARQKPKTSALFSDAKYKR